MNDNATIYQQALHKYGEDAQLEMSVEECAEWTVAVKHYKRGRVDKEKLADELADVSIMTEQMIEIVGRNRYYAARNRKLDRLAERIKR